MRALDHAHDLALKQLEDKQRLRDRRLGILQEGLTEAVEALVGLSEMAQALKSGAAGQEEVEGATSKARNHFDRARPRLVLDPVGREFMATFRQIQIEIGTAESMRRSQQALVMGKQPQAIQHGQELMNQEEKVIEMLNAAVDRAQQIMELAAQPVTA